MRPDGLSRKGMALEEGKGKEHVEILLGIKRRLLSPMSASV